MIRMGRKYDIDFILKDGIRRLDNEFVTSLSDWDKIIKREGPSRCLTIAEEPNTTYEAAEFAWSSDIPEVRRILPFALFLCNTSTLVSTGFTMSYL